MEERTLKETDPIEISAASGDNSVILRKQQAEKLQPIRNYDKLCGYLNKHSSKPLIRTAKRRWFVFCEKNCKLYYYKSSDNQMPLGEIDVGKSTFYFDATNTERPGLFTISTPRRDYKLEAKDRQACLFWLQELQHWRRLFSKNRTLQIGRSPFGDKALQGLPQSGLVGHNPPEEIDVLEDTETLLLDPVNQPEGIIGEQTALPENRPMALAQQRINQFRAQMLNSMKPNRPNENRSSIFFNAQESTVSGILAEPPIRENKRPESVQSPRPPTNPRSPTNLQKSKSPSLSTLRKKVQDSFRRTNSEAESFAARRRSKSSEMFCPKCKEANDRLTVLKDDISAIEDELSASKGVTHVLHKQLEHVIVERDTLMKVCEMRSPPATIELLRDQDREIVELREELKRAKLLIELQTSKIESLESSLETNEEKVSLFQELMHEKDKVVVSLTNEIFDLENVSVSPNLQSDHFTSFVALNRNSSVTPEEIEKLKDALQAFEIQNKFLNKEIMELNHLRRDGEERERNLMLCCSEWEARSYQIQSKLLFLLKELDKPLLDGSDKIEEVVSRLLEEAMEESPQPIPSWSRERDYDELGFSWKWGKGEDLLNTKATNLKQKSEGITTRLKDPELASWKVKWENFMANLGKRELQPTLELKHLVRSGIPREYRGRIWKGCVDLRVKNLRNRVGDNYYENILSASLSDISKFDPAIKQIELDLLRTLPNNKHYETLDSYGIPQLRRVLLAFSRHNPAVGYCQGLNRLAAIALLFLEEEDAFWLLVALVEFIMPSDYYSKTLMASQVDQRVLKDLMSEKLPRLHQHLEHHKVDLSLYTFTWFLTIFVDNIPHETYLRIWDAFLYEGSKVLFRFALAFLKMCEAELMELSDYMAINMSLRAVSENMSDIKRLTQIAFNELNPFPMRVITYKRTHHMHLVKGQFEELEAMRSSAESHFEHQTNKDDSFLSDDD